jgi:NAD(P)-dependent dehydrogenase (short-subunit alcohol dehydrogenase family)
MADVDMSGKTVVITGASSGIGAAAACQLHSMGARVIVVGRDPARTKKVADEVGEKAIVADFADLEDVRDAADEILDRCPHLQVLVNNAGLSQTTREVTGDGHELTFQVNHLAPFLLTNLLLDRLKASTPSRVITTASVANLGGFVRLNDLEMERFFQGGTAYATSKLENILFTRELGRRLSGTDVLATCFNPGLVATDLGRGNPAGLLYRSPLRRVMKSADKGADTLVWLATAPADKLHQGGYYSNRRAGVMNPQARSGRLARQLWKRSEKMVAEA